MWLADTAYRVAVRQQQEVWRSIAALMTELFQRMREMEVNRKTVTKEVLNRTVSVSMCGTYLDRLNVHIRISRFSFHIFESHSPLRFA